MSSMRSTRRALARRFSGNKDLRFYWHSPEHEADKAARKKRAPAHPGGWGLPRWIKHYRALQAALQRL